MRWREMDTIEEVAKGFVVGPGVRRQIVVLKFDVDTRFFGYAPETNSMVPYEGTCVDLSDRETIVWFEGLQPNNRTLSRRVAGPVHVEFVYPRHESGGLDLAREERVGYLQDALNLSGTNWRGFNAKSLPVSVYYARLLARYLSAFDEFELDALDLSGLAPWFL